MVKKIKKKFGAAKIFNKKIPCRIVVHG